MEREQEVLTRYNLTLEQGSSLFLGSVGTGKTTCLEAIARHNKSRVWSHLQIMSLYQSEGTKATDIILKSSPHLFCDDLLPETVSHYGQALGIPYETLIIAKLNELDLAEIELRTAQKKLNELDRVWEENKYEGSPLHPITAWCSARESYEMHRQWLMEIWETHKAKATRKCIITANTNLAELKENFSIRFIDRVRSRMQVVEFIGKSMRQTK